MAYIAGVTAPPGRKIETLRIKAAADPLQEILVLFVAGIAAQLSSSGSSNRGFVGCLAAPSEVLRMRAILVGGLGT